MSEINLSEIMRDVLRKEKEQKTAQRLQNCNVGRAVPTTLSKCEPSPAVKESLREASKCEVSHSCVSRLNRSDFHGKVN